jgi:hypothetical protein
VKSFTNHLQAIFVNDNFPELGQLKEQIMKMTIGILTGGVLVATLQAASAADITGTITLKGTAPPEKPIVLTDPLCGKSRTTPATTRFYAVGSGGELADVFVYIKEGLT